MSICASAGATSQLQPVSTRTITRSHVLIVHILLFGLATHGGPLVFHFGYETVTLVLRTVRFSEPVANAADRFDARRRQLRGRELRPQAGDVDIHGPRLDEPVASPDRIQQLLAAEDSPGRARQDSEQLELLGGELDGTALHADLEAIAIDLEVTDLDVRLLLHVTRSATTSDGSDACEQLARG